MNGKRLATIITVLSLTGFIWAACKKYKDPPATNGDDRLTNKYCNDPRATNYNWGFPGIDDSATCIFPVDKYTGLWNFIDTIYLPDSSIAEIVTRQLNFISTEDTLLTHMQVSGFCDNGNTIKITADRFHTAITDTLIQYSNGAQPFCGNTDTIMGIFNHYDSLPKISINLTEMNATGMRYHTGTAIKQ